MLMHITHFTGKSTSKPFLKSRKAAAWYQAFQATMLLKTGVTIRVPEFVVAPPYA